MRKVQQSSSDWLQRSALRGFSFINGLSDSLFKLSYHLSRVYSMSHLLLISIHRLRVKYCWYCIPTIYSQTVVCTVLDSMPSQ